MAAMRERLRHELRRAEFSEGYAESFLDTYIATQIKVLREQRHLTQSELATLIGTTQTVVSRIENVNYSTWSLATLKRLARAFNVRLHVSFESYGSLIDEVSRFSRETLQRPARDEDPALWPQRRRPTSDTDLCSVLLAALEAPTGIEHSPRNVDVSMRLAATSSPRGQLKFGFTDLRLVANSRSIGQASSNANTHLNVNVSGAQENVALGA